MQLHSIKLQQLDVCNFFINYSRAVCAWWSFSRGMLVPSESFIECQSAGLWDS